MGILSRLGSVLRSYLNDDAPRPHGDFSPGGDPELDAAWEELNEYLKGEKKARSRTEAGASQGRPRQMPRHLPAEIAACYRELGLEPGASLEECKRAYKNLLKVHHPDRHAGHPGNFKKATEKTARINAAYDRIGNWQDTGK